jgi:hypothetical protein
MRYTKVRCPLPEVHRLSLIGQEVITPRVIRLLMWSSPAAIPMGILHAWARIGAIIVNAIKRMPWRRPRPHIAQERCEVNPPFLRHRDTATTPLFPVCTVLAIATFFRMEPRPVLWHSLLLHTIPVHAATHTCLFPLQTSTRLRVSCTQADDVPHSGRTATTNTPYKSMLGPLWSFFYNRPTSKDFAGDDRLGGRHSDLPSVTVFRGACGAGYTGAPRYSTP